jgi:Domain of unknown function (DUF4260)
MVAYSIPDLSMLGYFMGPRAGVIVYDATHSHIGPMLLWVATRSVSASCAVFAVLIWIAHIGFGRALGYGLKYSNGFWIAHSTLHLGALGCVRR